MVEQVFNARDGYDSKGRQKIAVIMTQENNEQVNNNNPFPIKDVDGLNRTSNNTVFGEKLIGTRVPTIAAQFQYGLRSDDANVEIIGGGSYVVEDAMLKLRVGTGPTDSVTVQGADYLRYIPGNEAYSNFTHVFNTPIAGLRQRVGLFDADPLNGGDGFYITYEGLDFGVIRRRAGVETFIPVNISTVFEDGSFDPTKGNVYGISYGYLGFAPITFSIVKPNNEIIQLAKIDYPNTAIETHISNSNLPLRAELTNFGNTIPAETRLGSVVAGIVDGGGADPIARWFSSRVFRRTLIATEETEIITFRNKQEFYGLTNKITSQLMLISAATDGNKPVSWLIIKNPDIITPATVWQDIDVDSVIEYSTDEIHDLNTGKPLIPWQMAKSASFFEKVSELNITLRPGEWAVMYAVSQVANDVSVSIRYKDKF